MFKKLALLKKYKLSLLNDYAKVKLILFKLNNFCTDETMLKIKQKATSLNKIYYLIFFKLGVLDYSFLLFEEDLKKVKLTQNLPPDCNAILLKAEQNLKDVIKNFNSVEQFYLLNYI